MLKKLILFLLVTATSWASPVWSDMPVKVLVLGDSISAAYNIPVERGWVTLLQQRVDKQYPGTQIINASISGETSANAVNRLPALIKQHAPNVIVIELGGNDGLRGYALPQIRQSLQTLIDASKAAGAEVVLAGIHLNPNYGPKFNTLFVNMFRELREGNRIHWIPFILEGIGDNPDKMQGDAVHPTADAQAELLDNMWPEIEAAIKAILGVRGKKARNG
jgi:acyl-CoA thioesterase-1